MDARGQDDAEAAFMNTMRDYFHNLSASRKRKHADAIALAFCDERDQIRRVVGLPEGEGRHRENVFGATADYVTSRKRSSPSARRSNSEGMWPGA